MARFSQDYLDRITPHTFEEGDYYAKLARDFWPELPIAEAVENLIKASDVDKRRRDICRERLALFCLIYLRSRFTLQDGPAVGQANRQ
jgi:hypothetical protein